MTALIEHIAAGGFIAYVIVVIGVLCFAFAVGRIIILWRTARAVERQSRESAPLGDNPLARVMAAAQTERDRDNDSTNRNDKSANELLEWRLEEAYLRELPPLRFGLSALKLCAAILPMLGLLGTVLGMMEAIQSMAFVGADRTTAMASGISRALITTVLGLAFAVPIVLLHAAATACLTRITSQLEEYCARLVAYGTKENAPC